jgi:hypothetical protein
MKIQTVESSLIKRVAHCTQCAVLRIKFIKGGVYEYSNVPPWEYDELVNATSVGSYYHQNIKGVYRCTCLVRSDDTEGTRNFRLDSHVCHAAMEVPIQNKQERIAGAMFGKQDDIEVVYRIKGENTIYTSRQLLESAIKLRETSELRQKLFTILKTVQYVPPVHETMVVNFIVDYRDAIKEIL